MVFIIISIYDSDIFQYSSVDEVVTKPLEFADEV